jgi:DNA-binding LytR/AlgR family response regulator
MKILAVKMFNRVGDNSDFVEIIISDIKYVDLWSPTEHSAKVPAYHTSNGSYLALSTIRDISTAYERFGFQSFDKSTVINTSKIKEFISTSIGTKVVFTDGSHVNIRKKVNP